MATYSHKQLSIYEGYPLKSKPCYRDKLRLDIEDVERSMVHETLKKCQLSTIKQLTNNDISFIISG